jgi:hypothetical protein
MIDVMAVVIQELFVREDKKSQSNADEELTNRPAKRQRKMQEYLIVKQDAGNGEDEVILKCGMDGREKGVPPLLAEVMYACIDLYHGVSGAEMTKKLTGAVTLDCSGMLGKVEDAGQSEVEEVGEINIIGNQRMDEVMRECKGEANARESWGW